MKKKISELFNCLLFGFVNGFANYMGSYAGVYIVEKINNKQKRKIGF